MDEKKTRNKNSIVNIGTSLMVVILIGLSFAVIAALAISSSKNNYDLSENLANHTRDYYQASNQIQESIANDGWVDKTYEVEINDNQTLYAKVQSGKIVAYKVVNSGEWEASDSLPVHIEDGMGF